MIICIAWHLSFQRVSWWKAALGENFKEWVLQALLGGSLTCLSLSRLDTKYMYVCHAEMNAIMNKNSASVEGCTMYVALFPCNECAKMIIQVGNLPITENIVILWLNN